MVIEFVAWLLDVAASLRAPDEPDLSAKPDLTHERELGFCRCDRLEVWFQSTPEKEKSRDTVGTMSRDNTACPK